MRSYYDKRRSTGGKFVVTVYVHSIAQVSARYTGLKSGALSYARDLVDTMQREPYANARVCVTNMDTGAEVFRAEVKGDRAS